MLRHLMLLISLVVMVGRGLALHCWECNSKIDSECANVPRGPQDVSKLPDNIRRFYVDCDKKSDISGGKSPFCRKNEQEIERETRIIRGCGFESAGKECYKTANPPVKTFVCECREDGCNRSSSATLSHFLIAISLFISFCITFSRFHKWLSNILNQTNLLLVFTLITQPYVYGLMSCGVEQTQEFPSNRQRQPLALIDSQ